MNDSMYTAMFGALTQEHRLNIIANNLANVNTTAYKQDKLAFKDVMIHYAHDQIMEPVVNLRSERLLPDPKILAKPRITSVYTDFAQGSRCIFAGCAGRVYSPGRRPEFYVYRVLPR